MFAVSYVIIFAFHPDLHTDRLIMKDSFGHSLKKPADLSYLTRKQHKFKDEKTMIQLKNCTLTVYMRNNKIAISQMLTTQLKFAADCLLKWFNAKCKLTNLDLSNNKKRKHKIEEHMTGRTTIAVFAHFLSKKTLPNLMPRAKQCLMSILSFSRSISF